MSKNYGKFIAKIDINNPETLIQDYLYKKQLMRSYETFTREKLEKHSTNDGYAEKAFLEVSYFLIK